MKALVHSALLLLTACAAGQVSSVPPNLRPVLAPAVAADPEFTSVTPIDSSTHLIVGHTTFLTSRSRFSKVYVTDPNVLYAYTANPYELLITAKHSGISSVVVWTETGEMKSLLFSADLDITALRDSLQQAIPHADIRCAAKAIAFFWMEVSVRRVRQSWRQRWRAFTPRISPAHWS